MLLRVQQQFRRSYEHSRLLSVEFLVWTYILLVICLSIHTVRFVHCVIYNAYWQQISSRQPGGLVLMMLELNDMVLKPTEDPYTYLFHLPASKTSVIRHWPVTFPSLQWLCLKLVNTSGSWSHKETSSFHDMSNAIVTGQKGEKNIIINFGFFTIKKKLSSIEFT